MSKKTKFQEITEALANIKYSYTNPMVKQQYIKQFESHIKQGLAKDIANKQNYFNYIFNDLANQEKQIQENIKSNEKLNISTVRGLHKFLLDSIKYNPKQFEKLKSTLVANNLSKINNDSYTEYNKRKLITDLFFQHLKLNEFRNYLIETLQALQNSQKHDEPEEVNNKNNSKQDIINEIFERTFNEQREYLQSIARQLPYRGPLVMAAVAFDQLVMNDLPKAALVMAGFDKEIKRSLNRENNKKNSTNSPVLIPSG